MLTLDSLCIFTVLTAFLVLGAVLVWAFVCEPEGKE